MRIQIFLFVVFLCMVSATQADTFHAVRINHPTSPAVERLIPVSKYFVNEKHPEAAKCSPEGWPDC